MSAQGRTTAQNKTEKIYEQRVNVFKMSALVAFADFQQKEQSWNERADDFEAKSKAKNAFEVVANEVHTVKFGTKYHL